MDRFYSIIEQVFEDSFQLSKGDLVIIEGINLREEILIKVAKIAIKLGFKVHLLSKFLEIEYLNHNQNNEGVLEFYTDYELNLMKNAKAILGIREIVNINETLTKSAKKNILSKYIKPVHFQYRNNNLQWLYIRIPNDYFAKKSKMPLKELEDYYYDSCLINYKRLKKSQDTLVELIEKTTNVKILGINTDLSFELENCNAYNSSGQHNIPDGEVFTAPKLNSLNGQIEFNVPSTYYNKSFSNVLLRYEDGKLIEWSTRSNIKELEEIIFQDDGSKYFGEFALGLNPFIDRSIDDILFDEKMTGTLHFALGNAYKVADNGNTSSIHWDLILDQRTPYGGDIYFDDVLIRRNGLFVHEPLLSLNPNNLKNYIK